MALGKPAVPTLRSVDLREVQGAVNAVRERLAAIETQLTNTTSVATVASTSNDQVNATVNALRAEVARLTALVNALTAATSIVSFRADVTVSQFDPVWLSSDGGVSPVDPANPEAIFGVVGIATANSSGGTVSVQLSGSITVPGAVFVPGGPVFAGLGGFTQIPSYIGVVIPVGVATGVDSVGIAPSWPALLAPGVYSTYEQFLPATYALVRNAVELIDGLLTHPDGIVVLSAGNLITREIVAPSGGGVTVADGDGVLGNPTITAP